MDKILVVEDNAELSDTLCRSLQAEGFTPYAALSLAQARKYLDSGIDLCLLDILYLQLLFQEYFLILSIALYPSRDIYLTTYTQSGGPYCIPSPYDTRDLVGFSIGTVYRLVFHRLSNAFPNSLRHNVQYHVTARKDTPVQKINLYSVTQYFYRLWLHTGNGLPMPPDWTAPLPLMSFPRFECLVPF